MQLIEITEPNTTSPTTANHEWGEEIAVGIDFGTTHSLIAYSINGKPEIIDSMVLPSVVGINANGDFIIGTQDNSSIISLHSVKRLLAKHIHELPKHIQKLCVQESDEIILQLEQTKITPVQIAAKIILYLKNHAELYFAKQNKKVTKAVITVPAYFDDNARNQIKYAAELAGLKILRLIAEPTAAGYAYGLDKKTEGKYLVFDLGGGTFDVSLMNMQMGVFQILETIGDNNLGGDDIDHLIAQHLAGNKHDISQEVLILARALKEQLATTQTASEAGYVLDRATLNILISPILKKLQTLTQRVLRSTNIQEIKGIILAGGSTRLIALQDMLKDSFNLPLLKDLDPDKVVAYGAAIQAENLERRLDHIIVDVTPLSIGLVLMGGIVERVIERGTAIPVSVSKDFTTYQDGQRGLKLNIVQGEREAAEMCRSLASFELRGIPDMPAGIPKITVTFTVDTDGLLTVHAQEKITANEQIVVVKPSYGISEQQVVKMLRSAFDNSEEDHALKLLRETTIEAEQVVYHLKKRMHQFEQLLKPEEISSFNQHIQNIASSIEQKHREKIHANVKKLEQVASDFIARCFAFSAKEMLKGKKI